MSPIWMISFPKFKAELYPQPYMLFAARLSWNARFQIARTKALIDIISSIEKSILVMILKKNYWVTQLSKFLFVNYTIILYILVNTTALLFESYKVLYPKTFSTSNTRHTYLLYSCRIAQCREKSSLAATCAQLCWSYLRLASLSAICSQIVILILLFLIHWEEEI